MSDRLATINSLQVSASQPHFAEYLAGKSHLSLALVRDLLTANSVGRLAEQLVDSRFDADDAARILTAASGRSLVRTAPSPPVVTVPAATKPNAVTKPPTASVASIPPAPQRQHVASPAAAAAVAQIVTPRVDARVARLAEAKANASLYARMTGRRREVVQDHRPPPASAAVAAARRFGDTQRRRAGKPPRTGL